MNKSQVSYFDAATWEVGAAALVMAETMRVCRAQSACTIMLTGGRSAECLYQAWADMPEFSQLRGVRFFFGDERCVPPSHSESNYGMAMRTLFQRGVPATCEVIRMAAEQHDHEEVANKYGQQLPERLDIALLSVGEDGHIASLFPQDAALFEKERRVVPVHAHKWPNERLTITPGVITRAAQVFVMALGPAKAAIFAEAQREPNDILSLPARLALNATWFLDAQLAY